MAPGSLFTSWRVSRHTPSAGEGCCLCVLREDAAPDARATYATVQLLGVPLCSCMSKIRSRSGSGASAALCPRPGCGRNSHRSLELKSGFRSAFCSAISTVATSLLLRCRRDGQCILLLFRLSYGRLSPPTWLVSPVRPSCIIIMLTSLLRLHTLGPGAGRQFSP